MKTNDIKDLFGKRKVTVWKRYDKKKEKWVHNHLEFGHVNGASFGKHPIPMSEDQQIWEDQVWWRQHKHIDNNGRVFKDGQSTTFIRSRQRVFI